MWNTEQFMNLSSDFSKQTLTHTGETGSRKLPCQHKLIKSPSLYSAQAHWRWGTWLPTARDKFWHPRWIATPSSCTLPGRISIARETDLYPLRFVFFIVLFIIVCLIVRSQKNKIRRYLKRDLFYYHYIFCERMVEPELVGISKTWCQYTFQSNIGLPDS